MWGLPWGFILLPLAAWRLFRGRGLMIRDLGISRRAVLWFIFLLLAGCFITLSAGVLYINMGGVLALAFAVRLLPRLTPRGRLRAVVAGGAAGILSFAFYSGLMWWLIRLPLSADLLLPLLVGLLAALIGNSIAPIMAGLIPGLLIGHTAALIRLSGGLLAVEFGSPAIINAMLLALFCAWLVSRGLTLTPAMRDNKKINGKQEGLWPG